MSDSPLEQAAEFVQAREFCYRKRLAGDINPPWEKTCGDRQHGLSHGVGANE